MPRLRVNIALVTALHMDPGDGVQQVELLEFTDQPDLMNKLDNMDTRETLIVVPILNVSSMQEIFIREIVSEHNAQNPVKFIDDIAMAVAQQD